MDKREAMQHGLGYAAAREDASGAPTVTPDGEDRSGFVVFAHAYADGWAAYNAGERSWMTNARDAYDTWQRTGGATIFKE